MMRRSAAEASSSNGVQRTYRRRKLDHTDRGQFFRSRVKLPLCLLGVAETVSLAAESGGRWRVSLVNAS